MGKRLFAQPVSGFYDANQPLSIEGMVWDKKRRVRDDQGRLKCDYTCDETAEFGAVGGGAMTRIKRFDDPLKQRTFSHKNLLFPSDRSVRREIRRGFADTEHVDEWEKKILSTQGRRGSYNTQRQAMNLLADDFRRGLPNPASSYRLATPFALDYEPRDARSPAVLR